MPKGRLKRFSGVREVILRLLKTNPDVTIQKMCHLLKEEGFDITWKSTKSYLLELQDAKKVNSIEVGSMNKMYLWRL